ncbi:MAG: hypothetical protein M1286_04175 [Candidatus Marsarchaeota archaeon]|nr:hypothetical protein [Candidatus Marsarchaeota archaeon]
MSYDKEEMLDVAELLCLEIIKVAEADRVLHPCGRALQSNRTCCEEAGERRRSVLDVL